MKMKNIKSLSQGLSFALVTAITMTACGMIENPKRPPMSLDKNENGNVLLISTTNMQLSSTGIENNNVVSDGEYIVQSVPGDENASKLEFWEISEFEEWMEQQRYENQKLADSGDKSFYYKNADGDYVCRDWTQEDVDTIYAQWQEQLALMKQGYHFTKTITLSDGGFFVGAFDPETWNAKPESSPGSTIIILPDGSTVDLGHFDTVSKAVEKYLKQQVADGILTQQEADTILANGAIE